MTKAPGFKEVDSLRGMDTSPTLLESDTNAGFKEVDSPRESDDRQRARLHVTKAPASKRLTHFSRPPPRGGGYSRGDKSSGFKEVDSRAKWSVVIPPRSCDKSSGFKEVDSQSTRYGLSTPRFPDVTKAPASNRLTHSPLGRRHSKQPGSDKSSGFKEVDSRVANSVNARRVRVRRDKSSGFK